MSQANSTTLPVSEELGSYRTLSALAVLSFVLGLLSLLSFAPSWFFIFFFPPLAVVLGLLAVRQVSSAPEVYTGMRLAKLGIALGVVCAVGAVTAKSMTTNRIRRHGRVIADRFVEKLRQGDTEGAFWLKIPQFRRAAFLAKNSDDVPADLKQMYVDFHNDASLVSKELSSGEAKAAFEVVETAVVEHGTEYAAVVYSYHSPQGDSHLMVLAASFEVPKTHEHSWFIKDFKANYTPKSFTGTRETGHGHAH